MTEIPQIPTKQFGRVQRTKPKPTYTLRTYQQEAADIAVLHLRRYGQPFVIQAATGAGKSLIIAEICHQLDEPVLILQPSKEILEQNYSKLRSYGISDVSMYSASMNSKEIAKFTYATIGSIYKKPELFKHFRYVIIDECHGVNPKNLDGMYTSFLDQIGCRNVCGLTATPYRIMQKYIWQNGSMYYTASIKMINRITKTPFFKKIAYQIETAELINDGWLSPIEYYVDTVDTSGLQINSTGADFTEASLERFWNNKRLRRIAQAVEYSHQKNQRTLVFCSSILQATRAQSLCKGLGIESAVVTGKTTKSEREATVRAFKDGKIRHLLNVGVFTTGFDMPSLNCIVLARPTMSLALYYQMVGRGVRLDPNDSTKVLQVYDLAGIVHQLGRVETIRVQKEPGGFKDEVHTEMGRIDESPLFKYFVKNRTKEKLDEVK